PEVDEAAEALTAQVPLQPGENRIQVRLRNAWGGAFTSDPVTVRYARPPRVERVEGPGKTEKAAVDLTARAGSPPPPRPGNVRVEVNGHESQADVQAAEQPPGSGAWEVRVRGLTLDPGAEAFEPRTNEVRLWVENAEGRCPEPGVARVEY